MSDVSTDQGNQALSMTARLATRFRFVAVWGPGLLVMLADCDAGNVVTAGQAGARWGYRLLPLLLLLVPMLYMLQELAVRLGIFTGRGHGELIKQTFGPFWAWLSAAGLAVATIGSLTTEFTGVAGIGELFGIGRGLSLPVACAILLAVVATGSYRRTERAALFIGFFELAFFGVVWAAHPDKAAILHDAVDWPLTDRGFLFLAAAIIGAVFNPWMVFYQQSAVADKGLSADDYTAERWDTALGAILTQALTGAVMVAVAAMMSHRPDADNGPASLASVGEISAALTPALGAGLAKAVFAAGVLGAAMVAAIVSSLALAWGVGEVAGYRRSLECRPFEARWFYGIYVACVVASALLVWAEPDLVWLNIAAQVVNALLLPLVAGLLIALAVKALAPERRPGAVYLWCLATICAVVCIFAMVGSLAGIL